MAWLSTTKYAYATFRQYTELPKNNGIHCFPFDATAECAFEILSHISN